MRSRAFVGVILAIILCALVLLSWRLYEKTDRSRNLSHPTQPSLTWCVPHLEGDLKSELNLDLWR